MAYERPTLTALQERIKADIRSRMGTGPALPESVVKKFGNAEGAMAHGLYGFQNWISLQTVPYTVTDPDFLAAHCAPYKITQIQAGKAHGSTISLTGTNGSTIDAGSLWQRSDGVQFTTDEEAVISSGVATIAVTAVEAGTDGNTEAGVTLTAVTTIPGVSSTATVAGDGIVNGSDAEEFDAWKARLLARLGNPPTGGSVVDYELWTFSVSSLITRVWVTPLGMGANTVTVRFACDDAEDGPIPNGDLIDAVQAKLDSVAPDITDTTIYVVAPISTPQNFDITLDPDNSAIRAAVQAELADLLLRVGTPQGFTLYLDKINEAISTAAGEDHHVLNSPTEDVVFTAGQLPVIGDFAWS